MRQRGQITQWNDDRGFGSITPQGSDDRVFAHISAFKDRSRRPSREDTVSFELDRDERGRPRAKTIRYVGGSRAWSVGRESVALVIVLVLLGGILAAGFLQGVLLEVALVYLVMSIVTFVTYALDKSAAARGGWRTPESTLHLLSLAGGWPGALVGQRVLRHKSSKTRFLVVFWFTVAVNCAVVGWLSDLPGLEVLAGLLR